MEEEEEGEYEEEEEDSDCWSDGDPIRFAIHEYLKDPEAADKQSHSLTVQSSKPPDNYTKLPSVIPLRTHSSIPLTIHRPTMLKVDDPELVKLLDNLVARNLGVVGLFKSKESVYEPIMAPPSAMHMVKQADFESLEQVHPVGMLCWIIPHDWGVYRILPLHRITVSKLQLKPTPIASISHFPYLESKNYTEKEKTEILSNLTNIKKLLKEFYGPEFFGIIGELNIQLEHANQAADFVAGIAGFWSDELQQIINTISLPERLRLISDLLRQKVAIKQTQERLEKDAKTAMNEQYQKVLKRQMLESLKKDLGLVKDDRDELVNKFKARLEDKDVPEHAQKVINEELEKLGILEPSSSEFNVTRNYLDWLTMLPWNVHSEENLDIDRALHILNEDHYGLQEIKDRILEFIAVGNLMGSSPRGKILCFLGPPGVGKTSIGRSIARALDRKFFRFSVGGMTDVAEIKGHRRTYIGAMPGKLIQCLKSVQTSNPVILIDEIDKISKSYSGDPASALLEVLDPEQNASFVDHYLDVPVDLSKILFICTANEEDTIRGPLADRMEFIRLSGYITNEKVEIAKNYLIPHAMKACGIKPGVVTMTDSAIYTLIKAYCREAGVRSLEKEIEKVFRKCALKIVRKECETFEVTEKNIENFSGKPRFTNDRLYASTPEGVVCGLAWTAMGGSTLFIETVVDDVKGGEKGSLRCTGRLGETMKESSEIAYTLSKHYLHLLDPDNDFLQTKAIHLHVPAGAIAKDGPSAGITMVSALLSLALKTPVVNDIAMTGEISLTGKVMPIGGVREKTVAAKRAGIKTLIFPKENRSDYIELPDFVREGFDVHFVEYFDDVIRILFPDSDFDFSKLRQVNA